ncbi:MAG: 3-hydroxyisobutyrate dehydrogenase [Chloroflexi bacterium]|nr:3-hydroxyisobutyrate dehydrogenase [Chloroflexota bacterium]
MATGISDVGFIGLGTMGFPMANNLLKAGFRLVVHDLAQEPVARLAARGARPVDSPRAVAQACPYVITMLPASAHVEAVLDGENGTIAHMAAGGTLIEMSTIDPSTTRALAERATARGLRMIDAPVSGSSPKAQDGTLTIMVGGDAEVLDACRPILDVLGTTIVHVGPIGSGETVKLVNNLIAAISMAAVAEAFNIGARHGLDPTVMYEVIRQSSGDCWSLRTRLPYPGVIPQSPANEDFAPGFMTDLMLKDVGLALAAARAVDAPAELGAVAEQLYRSAHALGYGRQDFSAVAQAIQAHNGPDREGDERRG